MMRVEEEERKAQMQRIYKSEMKELEGGLQRSLGRAKQMRKVVMGRIEER